MDRKKLVLLLGALIVAIGTAIAARTMFAGGTAAPAAEAAPQPTGPRVLVAKRALPAGTIITADALGFQPWPQELVQDAYFLDGQADMNKLLGTVVRYPVTAGEPVTQGSLVAPGDRGFLAAALGPGMRAVTVPVSATTGVAGFVFAGDRIDLMLVQRFGEKRADGSEGNLDGGETLLENLRVLATDQATEKTTDENGKTVVNEIRTVTLEVTPRHAELIAIAQSMGTLTLSLRSISDGQGSIDRALAKSSVKIPENATPEEEERILKSAMGAPLRGSKTFQTAEEVSAFYRSMASNSRRMSKEIAASRGAQGTFSAGPAAAPGASAPKVYTGPSVRVTRGKETTEEQVATGARSMVSSTAQGIGRAGKTLPAAGATLVF
ncbi:Flp pilus assembly protein CpaB [Erythrobacter sp. WG]|uniref:Flp pilus assembly protein CpaB n=1 Tax=Erythrobacter sp. WG TaxID=2985510 RepID=UPI0022702D01|nr:Flp pilus assembly protein CpaB [Erythrobacter sp. WG]MCX9147755.1 Flp pilus assembly protein CpaB [Erythrobacter sp. WG]